FVFTGLTQQEMEMCKANVDFAYGGPKGQGFRILKGPYDCNGSSSAGTSATSSSRPNGTSGLNGAVAALQNSLGNGNSSIPSEDNTQAPYNLSSPSGLQNQAPPATPPANSSDYTFATQKEKDLTIKTLEEKIAQVEASKNDPSQLKALLQKAKD